MLHLLAVVVLLVVLAAVGTPMYLLYRVLYQADSKPARR
jgi:hypothetical protein